MAKTLHEIATNLLLLLAKIRKSSEGRGEVDGKTLAEITGLPPTDVNDAITILQRAGYVEWRQYLGTAPYIFGSVWITPVGRYEAERVSPVLGHELELRQNSTGAAEATSEPEEAQVTLPPTPIGSPYGFKDEDWEFIAQQKDRPGQLNVVLGYQFKSAHYDSTKLRDNVEAMFQLAVSQYNSGPGAIRTALNFRPLAAGYGEHLFNEIARDIIASDIAVFETSDMNPNVMVELGVALTWGVRVLPIKAESQPRPPSDISGQTWADYHESASSFIDTEHSEKLVRMVERAVRKKGT
jgi:hypothetical protein